MEPHTSEAPLLIKTDKNTLEIRNHTRTGDTKLKHLCNLNEIFTNNFSLLSNISVLQLDNCDLSEIPPNFRKCNLKELVLTHNNLREVPSCLYSGLQTLEVLDLSHNFIQSFDVEPACSCTIVTLKLNNNRIRNLPHWILTLRCPKLVELNYSNNHVVDLKASHELKLKKLEMRNCELLDYDFPFFKGVKTLEYLDVSNEGSMGKNDNVFKDIEALFYTPKWKNLSVLKLNNLTISILPQGIFWLVSLTELYLINCDLSWISEDIQYLTKLRVLDVSNNGICSLPTQLALLENLIIVKAPCNNISSVADFRHNMEILDLYNNYLDTIPTYINKIKFVDLEDNFIDTNILPEYLEKRDRFRQTFNLVRTNGHKEEQGDDLCSNQSYLTYSESQESTEDRNEFFEVSYESWDEENPVIQYERHPEVTSSDEEWDGKEDLRKNKQLKKYIEYDLNEEWIFCDAEE